MFNLEHIFAKEKSRTLKSVSISLNMGRRLKLIWPEVFQGRMAQDLEYGYYKKFTLGIYTTNPCWINEIQAHKDLILDKISEKLGKKGIVRYLKIHHTDSKELIQKSIPKKEKKCLSFEDKIREANKLKRLRGLQLCDTCKVMYTESGTCLFCKK